MKTGLIIFSIVSTPWAERIFLRWPYEVPRLSVGLWRTVAAFMTGTLRGETKRPPAVCMHPSPSFISIGQSTQSSIIPNLSSPPCRKRYDVRPTQILHDSRRPSAPRHGRAILDYWFCFQGPAVGPQIFTPRVRRAIGSDMMHEYLIATLSAPDSSPDISSSSINHSQTFLSRQSPS